MPCPSAFPDYCRVTAGAIPPAQLRPFRTGGAGAAVTAPGARMPRDGCAPGTAIPQAIRVPRAADRMARPQPHRLLVGQ